MLVVQSKEQIMLLKYQAFRKNFTASDYHEFTKKYLTQKKEKKLVD